jgi:hypothetical protein
MTGRSRRTFNAERTQRTSASINILRSSAPAGAKPELIDAVLLAVVVDGDDEYG